MGQRPFKLIHKSVFLADTDILDSSIDLIVTSPPYNVGKNYSGNEEEDFLNYQNYLEFTHQWLSLVFNWVKPDGRICINVALDINKGGTKPVYSDILQVAQKIGWHYHTTIVWNKGNMGRRTAWGSYKSASAPYAIAPVEMILVMYKEVWKKSGSKTKEDDITEEEFKAWTLGSWDFNPESAKRVGHEAPFPRELPKRCIKLFSFVGDRVLDPFAGSGTTMIESINNNRYAIGIEKESRYINLIKTRLSRKCGFKLLAMGD